MGEWGSFKTFFDHRRHRLDTVVLVLLTGTTFQGRKGIKRVKLPAVLSKTLPD